jgi:lipoprotein-anchoring transpeptidase ErfK/SrfK
VGRRRQRRIERAQHLRIGAAAVAAGLALFALALMILVSTVDDREAGAGTPTASRPAITKQNPALLLTHTLKKTVQTKRPPSPYPDAPDGSGTGRRIVYCISCQRVWLVEDDDYVYSYYAVSGRRGYPHTGTYQVIRRINPGIHGTLRLPYFVGFTFGNTTDVGFHGIPLANGHQIQSDSQLGTYRSSGCVRENQSDARRLWDWAPMGTKVVVIP